ncbi:MAG: arginine repressor [Lachnospiraceae bacterium]
MKLDRHAKILELIQEYDVETQDELAALLNDSGYSVTQATISRDIRQMNLTKISNAKGHSVYSALDTVHESITAKYIRALHDGLVYMDVAQNILVIKTPPGMASSAAAALDAMKIPEIVGCVAGDDTIMCAITSNEDAVAVMERLRKMIEGI